MSRRRLLTAGTVARILGVHRSTVYRLWDRGALPALRLDDGSRRMLSGDLDATLARARRRDAPRRRGTPVCAACGGALDGQ